MQPYADRSTDELRAAIRSLEDGLASGVGSYTLNGETTIFRSTYEIRKTLAEMRAALNLLAPEPVRRLKTAYFTARNGKIA